MSACGSSLRHIFDNTIPENSSSKSPSSLIDSLSSWNEIVALKPPVNHSFTEIFGELQFKEHHNSLFSSSSPSPNVSEGCNGGPQEDKWGKNDEYQGQGAYHKRNDSFSSLNSESLQICTEGLGSESLDDVEDMKISPWQNHNKNEDDDNNFSDKDNNSYSMGDKMTGIGYSGFQYKREKTDGKIFPPPISCIGKTGKPHVCFQSYRQDGRFVLKELRIPTHERLHASREDGRLRLCFAHPSDQNEDDAGEVAGDGDEGEDEREEKGLMGQKNGDEGTENMEERKEETEARAVK